MNNYPGMTIDRFNQEYEGQPVWNVGKPQQPFIDRFSKNVPQSPVLEIGCGTGDLSNYVASLGCEVVGIDFAPKAIEKANRLVNNKSSNLSFVVSDAFNLHEFPQMFRSALDCCFFHMLDDKARKQYADNLWSVLVPGGELHMLNVAIELPSSNAPREVSRADIEHTFSRGWLIEEIEDSQVNVTCMQSGLPGIYARIKKVLD